MKTVQHKSTQYEVPSSIWEMDLGHFIDLMVLLRSDADRGSFAYQIDMLNIISGISKDEINDMDLSCFTRLAELCTFEDVVLPDAVSEEEAGIRDDKQPILFEVDGKTYRFQPDYCFTKMEYASRVEDVLKGMDLIENLHIVLALTAWTENEVFDAERIHKKAELMCRAKMNDVFKPLFFFALRGGESLMFTRFFSSPRMKAERSLP